MNLADKFERDMRRITREEGEEDGRDFINHYDEESFTPIPPAAQVDEKESTRSLDGSETLDQSSRLLFMRTAGMVGAALAALPRIVTEIDGVAPAHSRTYRNILSAVGVLCADRMPLFTKKFSSNGCFQQGPRRSGEPLQNRHNRRW
jgi:hypothetical protein